MFKRKKQSSNEDHEFNFIRERKLENQRNDDDDDIFDLKREKKDKRPRKSEEDKFDNNVFDLKQAKSEVYQLGMKGMSGEHKEQATIDMLMRLGAEAPKKKCLNYKDILEKKKKEKDELKANDEFLRKSGLKPRKSKPEKEKSRDRNEVHGHLNGKLRYKDGVLKIPAHALSKFSKGASNTNVKHKKR